MAQVPTVTVEQFDKYQHGNLDEATPVDAVFPDRFNGRVWERHYCEYKVAKLQNITRPSIGTILTEEHVNGLIEDGVVVNIVRPK